MHNNKGMTLIELLVALAVSAIILTGVAYLLVTGLQLYGRIGANVEVQSEVQAAMNLIVDNVMEAKGICVITPPAGSDTQCVLLGDLNIINSPASPGTYIAYFKGNAVVTDIYTLDANSKPLREMYLMSFPNDDVGEDSAAPGYCRLGTGASLGEAAKRSHDIVRGYITSMSLADRKKWLLSRYITACTIEPDRPVETLTKQTVAYWNGTSEDFYYFKEPFLLNIKLSLEYGYHNGLVQRTLEDSAAVRSRLDKIYVDADGTMRAYERER